MTANKDLTDKAVVIMHGAIKMDNKNFNDILNSLKGLKDLNNLNSEFQRLFTVSLFKVFEDYLTTEQINAILNLMRYNSLNFFQKIIYKLKHKKK